MAEATKVFTAHIPLSLADRIDRMAEQLEHTRAWVIKQALANWIAEEEARDHCQRHLSACQMRQTAAEK